MYDQGTERYLIKTHRRRSYIATPVSETRKIRPLTTASMASLKEALQKLANGLQKKGCFKKYDTVTVQIGHRRQKCFRASKQYTISVTKNDTSGNALRIT